MGLFLIATGSLKIVPESSGNGPHELPGLDGAPPPNKHAHGGSIFTHWGSNCCPETKDTELLYSSIVNVGGVDYEAAGGGANYPCMPNRAVGRKLIVGRPYGGVEVHVPSPPKVT